METKGKHIEVNKHNAPKKNKSDKRMRARELRLPYVEQLYVKGYNLRQIQAMVKKELNLRTYSLRTVYNDRNIVIEEWKKERVHDIEANVNEKLAAAKTRNVKLWEEYHRTRNTACLTEVRHNDEFAADLLQLGRNKDGGNTNTINITYNIPQTTIDNMQLLKAKKGKNTNFGESE